MPFPQSLYNIQQLTGISGIVGLNETIEEKSRFSGFLYSQANVHPIGVPG